MVDEPGIGRGLETAAGIILMDSLPPAMRMWAPPARMRSAAKAMDCRPELQKRLMVMPVTVSGKPARSSDLPGHIVAGLAFRHGAAEDHVFDSAFGLRISFRAARG